MHGERATTSRLSPRLVFGFVGLLGVLTIALFFIAPWADVKIAQWKEAEMTPEQRQAIARSRAMRAVAAQHEATGGDVQYPSVQTLLSDYDANEIAADRQWKGKPVELTMATITDIGTDILGRPYLLLGGGVQAVFPRSGENEVARVRKGQYVTVRCRVQGKLIYVILQNCNLR